MAKMTRPTNADLARAAAIVRAGGLVAFPTETVYGLGANALDAAAVQRIYEAKGRPTTSPLIVHVDSIEMARSIADWPDLASLLAQRFWPGPLTLVLRKKAIVPDTVTAGLDTVGVRWPSHPVAVELIRLAGVPIAAPSANRFTELSPTRPEHVSASLGDRVDMILDGGAAEVGIESTVLSLAGDSPALLRLGMISRQSIEALIGPVALGADAKPGAAHASPGQHPKHYSPRTPLRFGEPAGLTCAYLWREHKTARVGGIKMPRDPAAYAAALYETLHRADQAGVEEIVIEPLPESEPWAAIRDRLTRASFSSSAES